MSKPLHLIPNELCPNCIIGGQGVIDELKKLLRKRAASDIL